MPGEVNVTIDLNRPRYPTLPTDQVAYVLIEAVPAGGVPITPGNTPLNLSLVLDRSGSMAGQKIQDLRQAAKMAIDQLSPQDHVSVILFDDHVDVLVPHQPVVDKVALNAQIDSIEERGGTQMSLGIQAGLAQLQQVLSLGQVSRMILLTDGETWDDEQNCRQLAEQARQMGVPITALGLGDDWNQALLSDLADLSGGNWDYIDEPGKIINAFHDVVSAMQYTVVTNASLILRLISGVKPRAVWRVSPLIDRLSHHVLSERDVQVSLGDLQASGQSVLVELTLPPRQAGEYRLAQAEVRYDVPATGFKDEKVQCDVIVSFTDDAQAEQAVNGRVMNIIEKVTAHKLQTRALDDAAAGDTEGATRKLRAAATRLLNVGEEEKAQQSLSAAQQIEAGQAVSAGQTKKLTNATRKLDTSELNP